MKSMKKYYTPFLIIAALCMGLFTQHSYAHLNSMSFSKIEIKENEVRWEMKFTLLCTLELFAVDVNSDNFLQEDELKSAWSMMYYYLSNKMKVLTDGKQLRMVLKDISFSVEEDDSYTVFDLSFPFRQNPEDFVFLCNVQEETDPYHQAMAEIHLPKESYAFVFSNVNYFDTSNISRFARKFNRDEINKSKEEKEENKADEKKDEAATKEEETEN